MVYEGKLVYKIVTKVELVMSNFSFCHTVFKRRLLQRRLLRLHVGNGYSYVADDVSRQYGKREDYSQLAITPYDIMFSTVFNNNISSIRVFQIVWSRLEPVREISCVVSRDQHPGNPPFWKTEENDQVIKVIKLRISKCLSINVTNKVILDAM